MFCLTSVRVTAPVQEVVGMVGRPKGHYQHTRKKVDLKEGKKRKHSVYGLGGI